MFVPESIRMNWSLLAAVLGVVMLSLQITYYAGAIGSR
jgi:hypothetical protein